VVVIARLDQPAKKRDTPKAMEKLAKPGGATR
jgi:hypothetical protein